MSLFKLIENTSANKILWGISITCFLWSMSTCMVFSILPIFMTEELKITTLQLGSIEGIAVSLAFVAKILSGLISDYYQKRKPLIIIGTLFSILFKILFALATNGWWIFFAKSLDRFSKGIRSSPADALIADISPKENQGRSYGLRQMLFMLGAVFGSLAASILLKYTHNDYRMVFWMALIPVVLSLIVIIFFVDDFNDVSCKKKVKWNIQDCKNLPSVFWQLILVSFLLMFARFSDSFLVLKARDIGLGVAVLPLLMMVYDFIHSALSLPVGYIADKYSREKILLTGLIVLVITNVIMIQSHTFFGILLGYILAGLHMGITHSLLSTLIAEHTLPHLRGTAFSIYYFSTGIAVLLGNHLAGTLSYIYNSACAPFFGGLIFSSLATCALLFFITSSFKNKKCCKKVTDFS